MPTPPDNQWIPAVGGGDSSPPSTTGDPQPVVEQPPTLPTRPVPNTAFPLQLVPAEGMVRITGMPTEAGLWPSLPAGVTAVDPFVIIPGLPALLTEPADKTFAADATLPANVCFYKNLTINAGVTVTGLAGGAVVVVLEKFTLNGTLTADALGATGGTLAAAPGKGGGAFASDVATPAVLFPQIQLYMPSSGAVDGAAGGAWPRSTATLTDLQVLTLAAEFVVKGARFGTNYGPIGGGGGGRGVYGGSASSIGTAASVGAPAAPNTTNGGSGVGAGGAGGAKGGAGGNGGGGGLGGGVLVVYCNVLSGSGTMTCNGSNGANGATDAGGGGGGAGGLAALGYHSTLADTTTLAANGGTGGTAGGGTGGVGGAGGAGYAQKFNVAVS